MNSVLDLGFVVDELVAYGSGLGDKCWRWCVYGHEWWVVGVYSCHWQRWESTSQPATFSVLHPSPTGPLTTCSKSTTLAVA